MAEAPALGPDRITGGLPALACGDALGAPAEFLSRNELQARWGRLTKMVGGGMWEPGEWTDDTGMALCVAEGILACPTDPVQAIGERFLEWAPTAKDVGSTVRAALAAYDGDWAAASRNTPQAQAGLAAGNGSLMRTLPAALAYADREAMLRTSARVSAMTHWDAEAEVCCAVYCLWVQALLEGQPVGDAWQAALETGFEVADRGSLAPDTPGPAALPAGFWERLAGVEERHYEQLQPGGYAGYVVDCLEAAAWCCLNAASLEEALVLAVNLAGEADTIAAVAGGAAGAAWGREALPARWLDPLYRRGEIEQTAAQLARLRVKLQAAR
jgi:ADP-ribosylglycohydrolase